MYRFSLILLLVIAVGNLSAQEMISENDDQSMFNPQGHHEPEYQNTMLMLPVALRLRVFMPRIDGFKIDGKRVNDWRRSFEAMFAFRPMVNIPAINTRILLGGEYHVGTTGSYALVSRSLTTQGGHLGIGFLYEFRVGELSICLGLLAQRHMQLATDLPPGEENKEIEEIVETYKRLNPLNRWLYYNEYGPAIFVESGDIHGKGLNWKAELFVYSPIDLPLVSKIPKLRVGEPHVAIGLLVFEVEDLQLPLLRRSTLKLDWTIHSPGAKFGKARVLTDGTGGITYRKKVTYLKPNGSIWLEVGGKQEIDPTGFYRNRELFLGVRVDGMFFR
ncbi:MAG: hypothetical protein D6748_15880 [Calditrichaeota bacterium]|nr:MAG: hypothetical protein D6748_15880 [Calditrichota bacterium]